MPSSLHFFFFSPPHLRQQVGNVAGHLLNLRVVEALNVVHVTHVRLGNKVDGNSLSPETTATSNAVDVILPVTGEVVVDDQTHLGDNG